MDIAEDQPSNASEDQESSAPPTQSPIGTPLLGRPRLEPSKPPSGKLSGPVSPTPPIALSEPFRGQNGPQDLLSQKLSHQPMNSSLHSMEMPEQLKEILAPTPPTKSPTFQTNSQTFDENNLVIENLPSRLTEEGFLDLFVQFGEIKQASFLKNSDGTSRGYGYVNFHTHEDALQAIKHYDGFVLWGKTLKASFATPKHETEGNILTITQFPRSWGTNELRACFQEFGDILEVLIFKKKHYENQMTGVIRFLRPLDARVALSSRNGWVPAGHGHALQVRLGQETQQNAAPVAPNPFPGTNSPTNNARPEAYEMPINLFGGLYSPPRQFEPKPNKHVVDRRSAPQITYQSKVEQRSKEKSKSAPPNRPSSEMVFLYNLPTFFQKAHVQNFCSLYGSIISVSMQKDNTGCYLGMAYVVYNSREEAKEAVKALNGCSMFKQIISATLTKS